MSTSVFLKKNQNQRVKGNTLGFGSTRMKFLIGTGSIAVCLLLLLAWEIPGQSRNLIAEDELLLVGQKSHKWSKPLLVHVEQQVSEENRAYPKMDWANHKLPHLIKATHTFGHKAQQQTSLLPSRAQLQQQQQQQRRLSPPRIHRAHRIASRSQARRFQGATSLAAHRAMMQTSEVLCAGLLHTSDSGFNFDQSKAAAPLLAHCLSQVAKQVDKWRQSDECMNCKDAGVDCDKCAQVSIYIYIYSMCLTRSVHR